MDNITHTLIGVLVGEATAASMSGSRSDVGARQRRNLLVTMMGVGSNLPDLDFIYSTVTGSKLDYLLHHRGHTHTLAGILGIALVLGLAGQWWLRKRGANASRADHIGVWLVALLAPSLHIAMDAANNYGVHPWWPINSQWFYGDAIFIIEPLFWAACAPLLFILRTRVARACVALVLIGGTALALITRMVPLPAVALYLAAASALAVAGWKLSPRPALAAGLALWLAVTVTFAVFSHRVHARVEQLSAEVFPKAILLDAVLTPMPVNPICWELILVHREDETVALRRAMLSAAPTLIAAEHCPGRSLDVEITAPLQSVARPNAAELKWHGELSFARSELLRLWNEHCQVEALMRFVRAPWLAKIDGAWVLGDLRYDREAALGFGELAVEPPQEACPRHLPNWIPPRSDLR